MRPILISAFAFVSTLALPMGSAAEPIDYFMPEGVEYDDAIPVPEDYLRHGLGDKPVSHDQMVSYLTRVALASDRISVETIGYSHEGRPILFFVITSPENHENLDEIQARHLARVTGESDDEAGSDDPLMLWFNYGVHGAESSGMDAVIPALYHYAAAQDDETEETLDRAVLLVVGILNPDGHARRINYVETFAGNVPVTDPSHVQHNMWVEARTNHYWFDLNRQWLLQTQPESKAWVSKWHEWKPHVSGDYHEMGSNASYYFHPGEPKRLNPLIPEEARSLTKNIANKHREFLDSEARLYFTEQGFDNFYVGKGSTYPQVNGSLGILFEAGAARGGKIETVNGIKTYADNIRTQFHTTLTTVAGALEQADDLHDFQARYFRSALELAAEDDRKAFVFTTHGDTVRLHRFVDVLRQHDVTVHELGDDLTTDDIEFSEGEAYVVPMAQRQYRMVRGIFDRLTEFEENVFYDVSGWTLPLAYDLDYAVLDEETFSESLLGDEIKSAPALADVPAPSRARYGYVFEWSEYYAPRALHRLLQEDILVRIAEEPFEIRAGNETVSFDRGAVFVPLIRQEASDDEIHTIMREIAEKDGIRITSATSGAAEVATDAVGGRSFSSITKPQVLLLIDDGLARYDAGEMWHLLDYVMELPVTIRRKDSLGGIDWSRYTHLIMVGGGNVSPSDSAVERIAQWIREDGGTLIAMRQSAHWAQEELLNTDEDDDKDEDDKDEEEKPLRLDYSEMGINDAKHVIGGTIVASDLDISHPLGFGYKDRFLPVHRNTVDTLDWPEDNPYAVVAAYNEEDLVLSGYASEKRVKEIAGTPAVIAERKGSGSVILMADNPAFRATFLGTNKLVMNAIFFSSMINRPSGEYNAGGHVHE